MLGKLAILLVADAGADGALGLESRISNARKSCFVLFSLFMRLYSMCSYAR